MSQVRVAVIGAGRWGRNLIRVARGASGCHLAAVCDSNPAQLARQAGQVARAGLTVRVEDVLESAEVDAVLIATPAATHADLAISALTADKDVFVEKPMALSHGDAQRMVDAARTSARRLMVGHLLLYHPAIVRMQELLRAGALGRLRSLCSLRLGPPAPGRDEGFWWSLAPHDVSIACHLLSSSPTHVAVRRGRPAKGRELIRARLEFSERREATIVVGTIGDEKLRRLVLNGELGTVTFEDSNRGARLLFFPRGSETVELGFDPTEPLECELRHFLDALRDGTPFQSDGEEGARVVRVLDAGARALQAEDQADSLGVWSLVGGQLAS